MEEMSQPYDFHSFESSAHSSATATARAVVIEGIPDERRSSPIRRTFLLFVLFDFIGSFIMWILYTQLMDFPSVFDALKQQVIQYTFETSMFDMVILAFWRLVVLELSYGVLKFDKPWSAAVATTCTCVVCLVKIFYYDFQHKTVAVKGSDVFDYIIIITSFILTWIETWFLDFRVLPSERAARDIRNIDESTPLLRGMPADFAPSERYFSPIASSSESEAGDAGGQSTDLIPTLNSVSGFDVEKVCREAEDLFAEAIRLVDDVQEWNLDTQRPGVGSVHINKSERKRNIYKFNGIVDVPPVVLYRDMVEGAPESPSWNPTLAECRRVHVVNENTDVVYNVVKETLGGTVSSRDFVLLRCWNQLRDGRFLVSSQSTDHPSCPPVRQHVRGFNGPTAVMMEAVTIDDSEQTNFTWILDSNPKGWIPQRLVDQAMVGVILDFMQALAAHAEDLRSFLSVRSSINDEGESDTEKEAIQFLSSRSSPT